MSALFYLALVAMIFNVATALVCRDFNLAIAWSMALFWFVMFRLECRSKV